MLHAVVVHEGNTGGEAQAHLDPFAIREGVVASTGVLIRSRRVGFAFAIAGDVRPRRGP